MKKLNKKQSMSMNEEVEEAWVYLKEASSRY